MEKYYWAPTREDRIGVCMGIFQVPSPSMGCSLHAALSSVRTPRP